MVGIRKARVEHFASRHLDVRRDKKAVDRQNELSLVICPIGVSDRGHGRVFPLRRNEADIRLVDQVKAHGLRPIIIRRRYAEIGLAAAGKQVLVEVSAANDVVSGFEFCLHVGKQKLQLLVGNFSVRGVGG